MIATIAAPLLLSFATSTEPLAISCPEIAKIFCGSSRDPQDTGEPSAAGGCGGYVFTYQDNDTVPSCPTSRFEKVIERTWTVTDACGDTASCTQIIDVVKIIGSLDIKPQSCPNPFQLGGNGVVPMSILGTPTFDVTQINPATLALYVEGCAGGPVFPIQVNFQDNATPFSGDLSSCGCHTLGPDGLMDMHLRFNKQAMQNALGLAGYPRWSNVRLVITGELLDGCGFLAGDCMRIQ